MIGKISTIILDTADVPGLSAFYAKVAGFTVVSGDDDWTTMATPDGWRVAFQRVADHVPPRWPDPEYPQQMHLDLLVADLPDAVARAEGAGATKLPGGGETFTVLADPSGHPFCLCQRDGVEGVRVADICIDCPDSPTLAAFYAQLLGMQVGYEGDDGAMISAEGQPNVVFQTVATYNAPQWPDPAHPQQIHLDIGVADLSDAERAVLALGATRLPGSNGGYRVYADPVGHPFCLAT